MNNPIKLFGIINPISGTGKQKNIRRLLAQHLDPKRFSLHAEETEYAGHASELAKKAISEKYDAVLAVGGDGTINEAARSLAFSRLALGIIPCGSGNGLARHLGIPMDTVKAIQWLNSARIGSMDTITANGQRFINVAGIGFDALISHQFAKMNSRGLSSYAKATFQSFLDYQEETYRIRIGKRTEEVKGMMLSFANSTQFGNNACIAPNASFCDGKMNLCLVRKPKYNQIPDLMLKMFTNKVHLSPLYREIVCEQATIEQESELGHLDGEPAIFGKTVELKMDAGSLKIFSKI
ncbi:MAG: diacylglycerol kinase [Cytophagales bacterium]|nr:diacylglycerol kinase [Cytophagales bacterium]